MLANIRRSGAIPYEGVALPVELLRQDQPGYYSKNVIHAYNVNITIYYFFHNYDLLKYFTVFKFFQFTICRNVIKIILPFNTFFLGFPIPGRQAVAGMEMPVMGV